MEEVSLSTPIAEVEVQLASVLDRLQEKETEVSRLRVVAENALAEAARTQEEASRLSAAVVQLHEEVESSQLRGELTFLRALEKLLLEHQQALEKEAKAREAERNKMDSWMLDLRESHRIEKESLLNKIAAIETEIRLGGIIQRCYYLYQ